MAEEQSVLQQTIESVEKVQNFKVDTLKREELGEYHFSETISPVNRLVTLFQRISIKCLNDLPDSGLNTIKTQADQIIALFNQIEEFDTLKDNASSERTSIIEQVIGFYDGAFPVLRQWISYSASVTTDFSRLETEARKAVDDIKTQNEDLTAEMIQSRDDAQALMKEMREIAGELGVTKEAQHFAKEADDHETLSKSWQTVMIWLAIGLGGFAILSLFLHKWSWLAPVNTYSNIQLVVSKILIFGVISYMLFIAAKNFLAHKHNQIINKHRQNALMTYRALVEASDGEAQNIVLLQAANCIYGPQSTGYSKELNMSTPGTKSVIEFLTKPFTSGSE